MGGASGAGGGATGAGAGGRRDASRARRDAALVGCFVWCASADGPWRQLLVSAGSCGCLLFRGTAEACRQLAWAGSCRWRRRAFGDCSFFSRGRRVHVGVVEPLTGHGALVAARLGRSITHSALRVSERDSVLVGSPRRGSPGPARQGREPRRPPADRCNCCTASRKVAKVSGATSKRSTRVRGSSVAGASGVSPGALDRKSVV